MKLDLWGAKMKKLLNTTKLVKKILEEQPETRNDDNLLWLEAIRETAYEKDCVYALDFGIASLMRNIRFLGLPSFESVSRARRKLQEKYPELRGTEKTRRIRAEREKTFEEYARNGIPV